MYRRLIFCYIVFVIFLLSGCATQNSNPLFHVNRNARTDAEEIALGQRINAEIMAQSYPYTEPMVNNYVKGIGNDLIALVERKYLPYSITILYDERIYATAAPGGYVYVTTGLLNFLENESELAGAIAHELARIQYQDPRLSEGKKVFDALKTGSAVVGPLLGPYGTLASMSIQALDVLMYSEKSKDKQAMLADELAFNYMVRASYDPQGLIDFYYKILYSDYETKKLLFHYLVSHPINMQRIEYLDTCFASLELAGKTFDVHRERYIETIKPVRQIYQNYQ